MEPLCASGRETQMYVEGHEIIETNPAFHGIGAGVRIKTGSPSLELH